jgi:hypothetical protein
MPKSSKPLGPYLEEAWDVKKKHKLTHSWSKKPKPMPKRLEPP